MYFVPGSADTKFVFQLLDCRTFGLAHTVRVVRAEKLIRIMWILWNQIQFLMKSSGSFRVPFRLAEFLSLRRLAS